MNRRVLAQHIERPIGLLGRAADLDDLKTAKNLLSGLSSARRQRRNRLLDGRIHSRAGLDCDELVAFREGQPTTAILQRDAVGHQPAPWMPGSVARPRV